MQKNHKAFLGYLLGWFSGLILLIAAKDKDLKFHAFQSILFSLATSIIGWLLLPITAILALFTFGLSIAIIPAYSLIVLVLWIILLVKAYKGENYKMIVIGNIAEKLAKKFSH